MQVLTLFIPITLRLIIASLIIVFPGMDPQLLLHSIVGMNLLLHLWELYLVHRQKSKHVATPVRPTEVQSIITEEGFVKARSYSIDGLSFSMIRMTIECSIMLAMLYNGYYPLLWSLAVKSSFPTAIFLTLHYITAFFVDLPLSLYEHFVIEERHGFNKYTISFYIIDAIKKLVLTTVITIPLYAGAVWLIEYGGQFFFLYLWVFASLVILAMMTIYPAYIAPLFDQYSPLPNGELKTSIENMAAKLHYPLTKIYVVDGSTRSGHSNAYMYGFWKNKRIVLYDTLLSGEEKRKVYEALGKNDDNKEISKTEEEKKGLANDEASITENAFSKVHETLGKDTQSINEEDDKGMGVEEVVAVVGHELGHWALNHTVRQLGAAELNILLTLFCFSFFHNNQTLAAAFGFPGGAPSLVSLLVIMQYVMGIFDEVSSLFTVFITRKMEFEADEFAAGLGLAPKLESALIKLSKDNLSMPVHDHLFSICKHTHPPVTERLEALKKFM